MVIGITGHQRLDDESAWSWVEDVLRSALSEIPRPLVGISSLAIGADQLFAELVLAQGGALHVVLPFPGYEGTFDLKAHRTRYQAILDQARQVEILHARSSNEESYLAAGQRVVDLSNRLMAVWNGRRAEGLGGTADIVSHARSAGREVLHIDPVHRKVQCI